MATYISGSLAYDRVMNFQGLFSDYILPDKVHQINVCFPIAHMEEKRGGTGGNIAYNLALLGEKSILLTSVGQDFAGYGAFLERVGLSLEGIRRLPDNFTAGAYITTDLRENQITGFHAAAMNIPCGYTFPPLNPAVDWGIIAPANPEDMENHALQYQEKKMRYIFDPGQQIASLSPACLKTGISGAAILVSNDYELNLICKLLNLDMQGLLELTPIIITTLGEQGSRISRRQGDVTHIRAARSDEVRDPTGAGDAYRAGLIKGILHNLSLEEAACLGSVCASFCVEHRGTQEHYYDEESVRRRMLENYSLTPPSFIPLFAKEYLHA